MRAFTAHNYIVIAHQYTVIKQKSSISTIVTTGLHPSSMINNKKNQNTVELAKASEPHFSSSDF